VDGFALGGQGNLRRPWPASVRFPYAQQAEFPTPRALPERVANPASRSTMATHFAAKARVSNRPEEHLP